jgi:hypothetical protein
LLPNGAYLQPGESSTNVLVIMSYFCSLYYTTSKVPYHEVYGNNDLTSH